jgi:hypothetical protein
VGIIERIKLGLTLKRVADAIERENKMGHDWAKTLKAAGLDLMLTCAAVLTAYFSDPANLAGVLGVLPEHLRLALIPLISAGFVALRKRIKHGGIPTVGVGALLLFAASATAQDAPPKPGVELTLYGGAMQFAERGQADKRDFVYRLTLTVPAPEGLTLFGRADYTRTQDGGDLTDPKTFRSVEGFAGARKDIGSGFAVTGFGGVSWDRDAKIEPTDARLYTVAGGVRYSVPGRGYVIAAAGHHGPVGGSAFLGSIVYEINSGASWFGDVAIPLDASRFAARPYTVKAGISARLRAWKF